MVLCILAGNFDPLIFVGVMPLEENIRKSTNNLSFISEITASDAGPDIIRSYLLYYRHAYYANCDRKIDRNTKLYYWYILYKICTFAN